MKKLTFLICIILVCLFTISVQGNGQSIENDEDNSEKKFNQEQYEMLLRCSKKEDMTEWNEWRKKNPDKEILLEGAEFPKDCHFAGINLKKAYLGRTRMEGAGFSYAHLEGADFSDARLEGAIFSDARLEGAIFSYANLEIAYISHANLRGADFFSANLKGAIFSDSLLEGAYFSCADLEGADFSGANLEGADFSGANLEGAGFSGANLEGADLRDVHLGSSDYFEIWNKDSKFTNFDDVLFGDAIFSLDGECEHLSEQAIQALAKAEVGNIRFLNPIFGKKVRDEAWLYHYKKEQNKSILGWLWIRFWWITSDYGRSLPMWVLITGIVVGVFGWLHSKHRDDWALLKEHSKENVNWFTPYYYSIVIFSTLGFGDITPKLNKAGAKALVAIEVILGYMMMGSLLTIFAKKLLV